MPPERKSVRALPPIGLALLLCWLLAGCAPLNVGHLARQPWTPGLAGAGTTGSVELSFWRFEYRTSVVDDGMAVTGTAYPREGIPAWAGYAEELWFAAYVADSRGVVLASAEQVFLPGPVGRGGVPFRFVLRLTRDSQEPQGLTFGYRMALVPADQKDAPDRRRQRNVFLAYEHAVQRF